MKDLWKFKDKIREFMQQQCATVVTTSGGGEFDDPLSSHIGDTWHKVDNLVEGLQRKEPSP